MNNVIVLGAAHAHVLALADLVNQVDDAQLVGLWDEDPAIGQPHAKSLGVTCFTSLEQAFASGPRLVLIGALPKDRSALAVEAASRGVASLVDKPLALSHQELAKVQAAVKQYQQPIITFYPYRGDPMLLSAKAALDAGQIGQLVRVMCCGPHKLNPASRPPWHWTKQGNGGALIDIGSHHFDLACWLAGSAPTWICADHVNVSQPKHPEFQDYAQAQLRFENHVLGNVQVDWVNPTSMNHFGDTRIWLQGSTGKIEIRLGDEKSALLWTEQQAGIALDIASHPTSLQWEVALVADLAAGRRCKIPQEAVFLASAVSLDAFGSASDGGLPWTSK